MKIDDIISLFKKGSFRALSRAISVVENKWPGYKEVLSNLTTLGGTAFIIGITGVPGSGKSTLVNELVLAYRFGGKRVGVIAVDPSSPFTGGAFLGDRVRMQQLAEEEGIYIRSMASRGSLGGLCEAVHNTARLMDSFGFDVIIIETIGVGQSEVDIVRAADTIALVVVPGQGDDIQASKAGLMEIGDLFVINKADFSGVERIEMELHNNIKNVCASDSWCPQVIKTVASQGKGIDDLIKAIEKHKKYLEDNALLHQRRKKHYEEEILWLIRERLYKYFFPRINRESSLSLLTDRVAAGEIDLYTAVDMVLQELLHGDCCTGSSRGVEARDTETD